MGVWRYQPPTKVRTGGYDRCFRPDGCLLLSEAINCYGKACVDGWTGEEIEARLGLDNDPPPSGQQEIEAWVAKCLGPHKPRKAGPDLIAFFDVPRVAPSGVEEVWTVSTAERTSAGVGWVEKVFSGPNSEAKARAMWAEEEPKVRKHFEPQVERYWIEARAAERWHDVFTQLREKLFAVEIIAWAQPLAGGKMVALPAGLWGTKTIETAFYLGDVQALWNNPHTIPWGEPKSKPKDHRVFIKAKDLTRFIDNHVSAVGQSEPRGYPPPGYRSPFVDLILRAEAHFGDHVRTAKAQEIRDWLNSEGRKVDPKWSTAKAKSMTTFLRHPDQQAGGAKRREGPDH